METCWKSFITFVWTSYTVYWKGEQVEQKPNCSEKAIIHLMSDVLLPFKKNDKFLVFNIKCGKIYS